MRALRFGSRPYVAVEDRKFHPRSILLLPVARVLAPLDCAKVTFVIERMKRNTRDKRRELDKTEHTGSAAFV